MGFFDRFADKKPEPAPVAATPAPAPSVAAAATPVASVKSRLAAAREKLGARDLPGAMALYEEALAGGTGDRADVLVTISGDLGSHGHVAEIIELIAPRYDADRHGPATGLNLLQAYLAVRNADAAGNQSLPATSTYDLDRAAPGAPTITSPPSPSMVTTLTASTLCTVRPYLRQCTPPAFSATLPPMVQAI